MEDGPDKEVEEPAIDELRRLNANVFAFGAFIRTNQFAGWVRERLTGLNSNVGYVHNKFMLVAPLGGNPIVIAGSANFSAPSTDQNDEEHVDREGATAGSRRSIPVARRSPVWPLMLVCTATVAAQDGNPRRARPAAPAPVWPDGTINLGAPRGQSGK